MESGLLPRAGKLMGLLDEILAHKRGEIEILKDSPRFGRPATLPVRNVAQALRRAHGAPLRLMAEIKFRSPSSGRLSRALTAPARAEAYERGGVAMISVLTDGRWFEGSFDDLRAVREIASVPLLCKDFIIDSVQIERAWASGADAVLLIVRCLPTQKELRHLMEAARGLGLEPFVEVTDEDEAARALDAGATVIGVNARDLDTLTMDSARAARVLASLPARVVAVHLSGLKTKDDTAAARSLARRRGAHRGRVDALRRPERSAHPIGRRR